ncbi:hypothetical protein [Micromonospora endolithica]|uniref:Uncharacterized protein n=1 Tax=Micromonospora endolithica TaxID=230091 RepID=A0A3A9YQ44_9ACTN|nr:hypothetical protein [Micromonospora endolithica]RKN38105.1 hypothetical protein D7223_31715 [Micromonospora endolithica]TWJ23890.1 hypothetical protein JD76_04035 [Micromonospora endolithica]
MPAFTPKGPWRTNPGLAALHLLVWHIVVVVAYFAMTLTVSDERPADCQDTFCLSPRDGVLVAGLVFGAPALLVAMVVSLVTLGVVSSRHPGRRAARVGLVAATPAFVLLAVAAIVIGGTR